MKYIIDFILANDLYQELKNTQIGTNLENLLLILKGLDKDSESFFKPSDLESLFDNYKKPYDICYGNLEMLRALKILKRISETKAEYELSKLGKFILKENETSRVLILYKLFNNLKSVKVLKSYIHDKVMVSPEEVSSDLGGEMIVYNNLIFNKEWKKPFNIPLTKTILSILNDLGVLQIDEKTKKYFLDTYEQLI